MAGIGAAIVLSTSTGVAVAAYNSKPGSLLYPVKQIIEKHIHKHLPSININFHSLNTVYFSLLSKLFPNDNSFMMTHISGETTDISVIKNGIIIESISFPLGRNFIVRRLLQEVPGITPNIAMSMIRINSDGHDSPQVSDRIKKVLSQAEEDWTHLFFDSVDELKKLSVFNSTL
jgi:hypothetical protein